MQYGLFCLTLRLSSVDHLYTLYHYYPPTGKTLCCGVSWIHVSGLKTRAEILCLILSWPDHLVADTATNLQFYHTKITWITTVLVITTRSHCLTSHTFRFNSAAPAEMHHLGEQESFLWSGDISLKHSDMSDIVTTMGTLYICLGLYFGWNNL